MAILLIIEDQAEISQLYAEAGRLSGYEPFIARDGREALSEVKRLDPTVILLDLNLPHVSGHYIYNQIRSEARFNAVPIIITTANNILAQAMYNELHDQDRLLMKPVDLNALIQFLKSLL